MAIQSAPLVAPPLALGFMTKHLGLEELSLLDHLFLLLVDDV